MKNQHIVNHDNGKHQKNYPFCPLCHPNPLTLLIQDFIDAADELISAHDSTSNQFEPEVARLSAAVSAFERSMVCRRHRVEDE